MRIAIYGKGGIGKSTITSNLSAALSTEVKRVLQIGCDPKHDSTRLLLGGKRIHTVLDYLRDVTPSLQHLSHLLHRGFNGITCVEAGGPEPGVGCAGRGILSTFEVLERLGLSYEDYDVTLYDVLGDVVCGGFAVPLRKGYAQRAYVVTSEEFMSLYAANNIIKGIRNFEGEGARLAGLILNSRGPGEDPGPVHRFSRAVGVPILATVPRSESLRRADRLGTTLTESFPKAPETALFKKLAKEIRSCGRFFSAIPLEDRDLEEIFAGSPRARATPAGFTFHKLKAMENKRPPGSRPTILAHLAGGSPEAHSTDCSSDAQSPDGSPDAHSTDGSPGAHSTESSPGAISADYSPGVVSAANSPGARFLSKSLLFREPLHGCAFTGAVCTVTQIENAVTVVHSPGSCAHIANQTVVSSGLRARFTGNTLLPLQLTPAIRVSKMDEGTVIFGGTDLLSETIRETVSDKPEAIFVVTSCPSGIIGDDVHRAIGEGAAGAPDIPVIPIASDGNLEGDYAQGVINGSLQGAASLIDPSIRPRGDMVNIVAEKNIAGNAESNFNAVASTLAEMGIGVNCRFIRRTSVKELRTFQRAKLNLPAYRDHFGRVLENYLRENFDAEFLATPFPVGFEETAEWLGGIARFFDKEEIAQAIIKKHRDSFEKRVARLRPSLSGKRMMIVTYLHDIDWIVETALAAGMEIVKAGILNYSQDHLFRSRYSGKFPVETDYPPEKRDADLREYDPHILICNYAPANLSMRVHLDTIPLCPDVGFYGGLHFAERWARLMKAPVREGWRDDTM